MKKIYVYYCLLFFGSLLPFLIVELYFQDYVTFGILVFLASAILIVCMFLEYLRVKIIRWSDVQNKLPAYSDWVLKEENAQRTSLYYFRDLH